MPAVPNRPRRSRLGTSLLFAVAILLVSETFNSHLVAQTVTVLHTFTGASGDGFNPLAPLIAAPNGRLYGTTYSGGDTNCGIGGCGTVFEEELSGGQWNYSTIYEFTGGVDGCCQTSTLTRDKAGRLYGVTTGGSFGRIFRLTPGNPWHFEILYSFQNQSDGEYPLTPLFIDSTGSIFGATQSGSLNNCPNGCGAIFQIMPPAKKGGAWTEKTLYQFPGGANGGIPTTLIMDASGVIFGTTNYDGIVNGSCPNGCGVAFRLQPSQGGTWTYSVIYTFNGHPDGNAFGSLFEDATGNLFGLAFQINKGEEIFELTPSQSGSWTRTIAYVPKHGISTMTPGVNGVIYGVETGDFDINAGTLYQLTPQTGGGYTFKMLANFNKGPDRNPDAILSAPSGTLYGTLSGGSSDGGMVISVH